MRFFLCLFFLLFSHFAHSSTLEWVTNYSEALYKGKKEQKPLLLFFTGSDWSGWGMKMKKEILDAPDFSEKIKDHFICVEIDFPLYKKLSPEILAQNRRLKEHLEINEYPRIVIVDLEEKEIARLGYSPKSGETFADDLIRISLENDDFTEIMEKLETNRYTSEELENYYKQAQELQRKEDALRILHIGLFSHEPLFFLLEKYRLLVEGGNGQEIEAIQLRKALMERDPQNERGTQFSLALIDFQDLSSNPHASFHPEDVIKPLKNYLNLFGKKDSEHVWQIEMMIAQFYLDYDEWKTAFKHAEVAYQSAPLEKREEIERSLDYIRKQVALTVQVTENP